MRQMNQDGSHGQQEAAELLSGVNAANSQFVLTKVALKTSWEAEPNEDERERHQNKCIPPRSVHAAGDDSRPWKSRHPSTDSRASLGCRPASKPRKPDSGVSRRFRGAIQRIRPPQPHVRGIRGKQARKNATPARKKRPRKLGHQQKERPQRQQSKWPRWKLQQ